VNDVPQARPAVGIGYREAIGDWTIENLDRFDVIEIMSITDDWIDSTAVREPPELEQLVADLRKHGLQLRSMATAPRVEIAIATAKEDLDGTSPTGHADLALRLLMKR
jgi:hypothetical protein